jgi:hypothetical protein
MNKTDPSKAQFLELFLVYAVMSLRIADNIIQNFKLIVLSKILNF